MNTDNLIKRFAEANLELQISDQPLVQGISSASRRRGVAPPRVEIIMFDIKRRFKGNARSEYFVLFPGHEDNLITVQDVNKEFSQLLLLFKEPKREFVETMLPTVVQAYNRLGKNEWCRSFNIDPRNVFVSNGELKVKRTTTGNSIRVLAGRDERQLFMTTLSAQCTTVAQAHALLKTPEVYTAEGKLGRATRQGEWFFLMPTEGEEAAINNYLRQKMNKIHRQVAIGRMLGRTGGKPHTADEFISMDTAFLREPVLEHGFSVRSRNLVFVRGKIRHADHATVQFSSWRKVMGNSEVVAQSAGLVGPRGGAVGGGTWVD